MVRKVGGFTFQELNLSIDDIRASSARGADLSYDFVNRPAYDHALATGDTEFLRMTLNLALQCGVEAVSLVHALQNHDEMTYELVHFATVHAQDMFTFRGGEYTGEALAIAIRSDLIERLTGERGPYNLTFTTNGIASTTASIIAASLGFTDVSDLDDDQIDQVRRAHLLLAMFNALQPGVFALSGWDLVGALTLDPQQVAPLLSTGDTRWINRAAYDLMDYQPDATQSASLMPRGVSLYGSLPQQMRDEGSFARQLAEILRVRKTYKIATSTQVDVPQTSNKAMLVMVHRLDTDDVYQVTVLNFSDATIFGHVRSEHLQPSSMVEDMFSGEVIGEVDDLNTFSVALGAFGGKSLLVRPRTEDDVEVGVPDFSDQANEG
jgi:trehalose synthase